MICLADLYPVCLAAYPLTLQILIVSIDNPAATKPGQMSRKLLITRDDFVQSFL